MPKSTLVRLILSTCILFGIIFKVCLWSRLFPRTGKKVVLFECITRWLTSYWISFLNFLSFVIPVQGRSHWGGGAGGLCPPPFHFNFWTKEGPKVSASNTKDIAFYGCSEIIGTINFTIFIVHATIFGQFRAIFNFLTT